METDDYVMLSALQHFAYCPRQFALIHIEQVWADNFYTAEGQQLHQRVDSGEKEKRGKLTYERGVQLVSEQFRIRGKMDLLEIEAGDPSVFFPVEYKRGKPKTEPWDRIQLCAQALCIEEMRQTKVAEGAIWYWETRTREAVVFDDSLRRATVDVIESAFEILNSGRTPPPTDNVKRCLDCSLKELCQPKAFTEDWTARYVDSIGK